VKLRWSFAVIAVLILLVVLAVCFAQVGEPWERQGTKAGEEITGPDGGKMVWVPAGEFDMGAEDLGEGEKPVHHVRISRGFWLGKCTVTNAQYRRYCQETGTVLPLDSGQNLADDHPMADVKWKDSAAYCQHYGVSLPTEAQWEYAARGPEGRKYPWGNEWDPKKCCNGNNQGPKGNTFPVGSFPEGASWCGALDMAGNLWQWCSDWYDSSYYASSPADDPRGPEKGEDVRLFGPSHVIRGGCWLDDAAGLFRAACRAYSSDEAWRCFSGAFRCVRVP
jgi:formylglycine-generating enzyme required for sulfatase activity